VASAPTENPTRRSSALRTLVFCLRYSADGRRRWETLDATNLNAALAARATKETALLSVFPAVASAPPKRINLNDAIATNLSIIDRLWIAPDNAKWTPRADAVSLSDFRQWSKSDDIEVLGFTSALIHDNRFRIEPSLTPNQYVGFATHYLERCLKEDPESKWAEWKSRFQGGGVL